ncbi:tripartite tricarboxylate transporter TctB family protein [Avibacterium sp. 21-586]|uniref:tripartite tricarboxylate transporter TctB family protein n=1 Tax=Avibacterium sp. 21-586 TaxID=2911534 RepID=UPI00224773A9|nr:tripartite tricarboxylate transporter TctB family protein [Avibacterium sp. 21-586]MCW9710461.1 tripartite tricarboxylate transporter TctB family protein [Avibacterium sp. 21-586]
MRSKKNFFIFFTIFAFASVVIYLASQFRDLPPILQRGLQPSTFPIICAIFIILLSFILWLKSDNERDKLEDNFNKMTIKIFLIIPVFIGILNIDFFLAVTLSALAIHMLWTDKIKVFSLILLGIILPIFVYILFDQILGVKFPEGILINYISGGSQ